MSRARSTKKPAEGQFPSLNLENLSTDPLKVRAGIEEAKRKIKLIHAGHQFSALAAQVSARADLVEAAADLLPNAIKFATQGKPRLLAVLTKIINDRNIKFHVK